MCPIPSNSVNDLDLVVVPVVTLNPKKAKKKMKKAACAEDRYVDSRLPVDKFGVDSIEVVAPVSLNSKKVASKKSKTTKEAVVENRTASSKTQAECTPTFKLEGLKKSWYDITMDDDDDFCGAFSNY